MQNAAPATWSVNAVRCRGSVRSATVIAVDTVRALVMTTTDYATFVSEHPGVPDLVKKQIYDRLIDRSAPSGPDA